MNRQENSGLAKQNTLSDKITVKNDFKSAFQVMLGASCISFSAVFVRLLDISPYISLFYRVLLGGSVLFLVALLKKERFAAPLKVYAVLSIAVIFFCLDLAFWHKSIYLIGPGLATILANFHVFFMAIFGVLFFKERLSLGFIIGIPLALFGLWLILDLDGGFPSDQLLTGIYLGIISAVWFAVYVLVLRWAQGMEGHLSSVSGITTISFGCALVSGIFLYVDGLSFTLPNLQIGLLLLAYGTCGQALGWLFLAMGLPKLSASLAGPLMLMQPILAFIWDVLFFNRPLNLTVVIGVCCTISALYIAIQGQFKANTKNNT